MKSKKTITVYLLCLFIGSIFLAGFSSAEDIITKQDEEELKKEDKTFIFKQTINGEEISWEVVFRDNKIVSLFKNGDKIPDNVVKEYESMIYDELGDLHFSSLEKKLEENLADIHVNIERKNKELEHKDFLFQFKDEEFKESMNKLAEEMEKLKGLKIEINFDSEMLKENLNRLKEELADLKFDKKIHIDFNQAEIENELKNINIKIKEELKRAGENLKEIDFDLMEIDELAKNIKNFKLDLREELVKDGYIKDTEEDFNLKFSKNEMIINGQKVPDNLLEKYKALYRKHFNRDMKDGLDFHIN